MTMDAFDYLDDVEFDDREATITVTNDDGTTRTLEAVAITGLEWSIDRPTRHDGLGGAPEISGEFTFAANDVSISEQPAEEEETDCDACHEIEESDDDLDQISGFEPAADREPAHAGSDITHVFTGTEDSQDDETDQTLTFDGLE